MRTLIRGALFLGHLSLLLTFSSCSKNKSTSKQIIRLAFSSDPPTLNPVRGGDVISSTAQFMLFEGLTKMTKESSTTPALAKSIVLSEDKKTYIFLLKSVAWSDGHPVTAHDFVYAWKQMLSPDFPAPNAHLLYPILNAKQAKLGQVPLDDVGIKAKSDKLLIVTLEKPTPYFLELTSFCSFFPIPSHIAKQHPNWADKPGELFVTNGPFSIESYSIGNELKLVKNTLYHNKQNVSLDEIIVKIIDDPMTALLLFEKGEIDFLGSPCSSIPSDSIPSLKSKNLLIHQPLGASSFFSFNVNHPPFTNTKIRKALSHTINREAIVQFITQVNESPMITAIPTVLKKATTPSIKPIHFSKDECQTLFEEGLKELGLTRESISPLTITINENDIPKKIAQEVLSEWKKTFDIDVSIETVPTKSYLQKLYSKDFDIAYCQLVVHYNDAMNILERFKHGSNIKNYCGWENAEFIKILDESSYIHNHDKRIHHLEKAEQILLDEMPFSPIYHWNEVYIENANVKNIFISPIGSAHFENCKRI
ncbi:hypothetical protein COB21_03605 [Candidatus Aerophobetes bacterium]|uniref:Solute-binding protein family 5 domain-containing protein n=1 Tax=Aerophobetes bacterium TaxID=2030807 RepID=A0A2A4X300_UNCAE|nr:MAG: hypothetical protein COB21_03605 [Candidatus Aerophobetes bacterium]